MLQAHDIVLDVCMCVCVLLLGCVTNSRHRVRRVYVCVLLLLGCVTSSQHRVRRVHVCVLLLRCVTSARHRVRRVHVYVFVCVVARVCYKRTTLC